MNDVVIKAESVKKSFDGFEALGVCLNAFS